MKKLTALVTLALALAIPATAEIDIEIWRITREAINLLGVPVLPGYEDLVQVHVYGEEADEYHAYVMLSDGSARWFSGSQMSIFLISLPPDTRVIGVDLYSADVVLMQSERY